MQIDSYRTRLEEFERKLNWALYRYCSGLTEHLETVTLYADYSDLFCVEGIREIASALDSETFESRRKSLQKIREFLIDRYFDYRTAPVTEEITRLEASRTLMWEGKEISASEAQARIRTETDAFKRRKLAERRAKVMADCGELAERRTAQLREAASRLGFQNYIEAREQISSVQYEKLADSFDEVLSRLEDKYTERFRVSLEATLGIPFQETGSWDVAHWEAKNDQPHVFSGRKLAGVVETAVAEMDIRPENSEAVTVDLERRSGKKPGAFCIPIRVPQEIKIVMTPDDGSRHYAALLHESGHACHLAWTNPALPAEHRLWGDRALCECYGFLLEHLIQQREWLARRLLFTGSGSFLRFQALYRIFLIRRCVGKLRFGISLHQQQSFNDVPHIHSEIMQAYTGLRHLPESWIFDFFDGFASVEHLRGWLLEAMLRDYLRTRYGNAWALSRSASGFLKEIWETGLLYNADELCREMGIGGLEPQALADELWKGLQD